MLQITRTTLKVLFIVCSLPIIGILVFLFCWFVWYGYWPV